MREFGQRTLYRGFIWVFLLSVGLLLQSSGAKAASCLWLFEKHTTAAFSKEMIRWGNRELPMPMLQEGNPGWSVRALGLRSISLPEGKKGNLILYSYDPSYPLFRRLPDLMKHPVFGGQLRALGFSVDLENKIVEIPDQKTFVRLVGERIKPFELSLNFDGGTGNGKNWIQKVYSLELPLDRKATLFLHDVLDHALLLINLPLKLKKAILIRQAVFGELHRVVGDQLEKQVNAPEALADFLEALHFHRHMDFEKAAGVQLASEAVHFSVPLQGPEVKKLQLFFEYLIGKRAIETSSREMNAEDATVSFYEGISAPTARAELRNTVEFIFQHKSDFELSAREASWVKQRMLDSVESFLRAHPEMRDWMDLEISTQELREMAGGFWSKAFH